MTYKTRKRIWPVSLVAAIGMVAVLAALAATALMPGATQAQGAPPPVVGPSGLAATASSATEIMLQWRSGLGHASYEVQRADGDGSDPAAFATIAAAVSGTATSYTDSGRTPNNEYSYRVRGVSAGGESPWSNIATVTTPGTGTGVAPAPAPTPQVFVANAVADRKIELKWLPIAGASAYEIRYRNLDEGGSWTTVNVSADTLMHTLEDDDLEDGALYEVQLRGSNQGWEDALKLEVLGPVIQFSSSNNFMRYTGQPIDWQLPRVDLARGAQVRYSIVPALPKGLTYGQSGTDDYVDLAATANPRIKGAVNHGVGGSNQFYRLRGCDVASGVVDETSCDTHIFKIEIKPATVKPLADVIRDREYVIGKALSTTHPQNQFPQVGSGAASGSYQYSLLDENYQALNLPGLTFNARTRQLSGTPTADAAVTYPKEYRVTYRASRSGSSVYHEAEFTIHIVEIESHVCRTGLNYEETLRVYNKTDRVGSANFTVGVASDGRYVLPIGEKGQRGVSETRTRTFELITVKRGGDLAAPNANVLPAGLQVVKLMVDEDSVNPLNSLYTRQGFYRPTGAVTPQMMTNGRYADPEPDYPTTDNGYRLAIGVADASMLKEGEYLSCFIVHDTDDDTGETDSSAVVFNLNVLPNLSARDWVIELNGEGDMSELDVDQAFTTAPSLLNYSVMYVDDGAAKNSDTGCIASAAANPKDIVSWSTVNDTVTFTAREVSATMTQRVQVKATLKTGGAEACVQVRITVLPEHMPTDLTAPTGINTCVAGDSACPGLAAGSVKVTWTNGANALSHLVLLFDTSDWTLAKPVATMQDSGDTTFSGVPAGSYIAVVVAYDANANVQLDLSGAITVAAGN